MTLYKTFKNELECLLQGKDKIAVAVSGGSDSMALALLLNEFAKESGAHLIAITVDHRLRAESALEAKQVNAWLAKYGIEHHTLCWEGDKKLSNIQSEARSARYNLMADFCALQNIEILTIGHTSDDQAETVLMRLMRGSGVDGLSGIAPMSEVFGIKVIRPLLQFGRMELRAYLQSKKQQWIEDPSNENTKFTRVQVRNLIKANDDPQLLAKRLADTAAHMARAKDYIEERIKERLAGIFTFHNEGFYTVNIEKFKTLHIEERLRSLAAALQHVSGHDYKPRFDNLEALHDNIINDNIVSGCTLWGAAIVLSKKKTEENILFIYREAEAVAGDIEVKNNHEIEWDGRFVCNVNGLIEKDLRIGALTKEGYLEINLNQEQFLNRDGGFIIPKKVFYTIPALKTLEKVLAVPHIGYYATLEIKEAFEYNAKTPPFIFRKM